MQLFKEFYNKQSKNVGILSVESPNNDFVVSTGNSGRGGKVEICMFGNKKQIWPIFANTIIGILPVRLPPGSKKMTNSRDWISRKVLIEGDYLLNDIYLSTDIYSGNKKMPLEYSIDDAFVDVISGTLPSTHILTADNIAIGLSTKTSVLETLNKDLNLYKNLPYEIYDKFQQDEKTTMIEYLQKQIELCESNTSFCSTLYRRHGDTYITPGTPEEDIVNFQIHFDTDLPTTPIYNWIKEKAIWGAFKPRLG